MQHSPISGEVFTGAKRVRDSASGNAEEGEELVMDKVLLTVTEAAQRLSLGRATTYQLVQRGELPVVRIGRAVRIPARALDAWIAGKTRGGMPNVGTKPPVG